MSSLLLLSGGIDSVSIAAWKRPKVCLTIDYGQNAAAAEIQASEQVCKELKIQHHTIKADIQNLGSGDMSHQPSTAHSKHTEFWPFRNQYIITIAAMFAIQVECEEILIGTVVTDNRHKDGSVEFLDTLDKLLSVQEGSIRLTAPASNMTTYELVEKSKIPIDTLAWSHSCYLGNLACGQCDGCYKHSELMRELKIER